ncbi:MAG: 2-oxoacid:ferredoxin oxidoreductase subunit beta [Bacteroidales bacterium]|jgi:2-oxoglutarate ferredoxin oxidoreductase subunit beta|nr:2-oxoacid:ferredoxin oxidoreductase subunit beta [Bacteroidales bacterium]
MAIEHSSVELTRADFASDQMVKWCPGCGDHSILASVLGVFPKIGYKKENFCMVSGIGCSSRFPYYVNTYGFHSIHGRAAAIATGIKISNPNLSVWINSGDGDATAIGGNHFIHLIRRNMDVNYILFNNEIYGLTKGQYSPTTKQGQITKTSPFGVIDYPFNPGELVIGARGTFFARAVDNQPKTLTEVCEKMAEHDGTSVVEVLQNCVIFNNGTHSAITDKEVRDDRQLWLKHGEPMLFGKNREKGIILKGTSLEVVTLGSESGITEKDILIHDETTENTGIHMMLAQMRPPHFPMAFGVIRAYKQPTYKQLFEKQMQDAQKDAKICCVEDLLNSGETWEV